MAALMYIDQSDYAALLLRRTYQDLALPGALMDRAHEWLQPTPAKWSERDHSYTFPSGATLGFGYLESENDKYRYGSAEFQFLGFDELTTFSETQYRFMFTRTRRLQTSGIPIRVRSASNPVGIGVEWVRRRFVTEGWASGRPFVPALLEDNPSVDREAYDESLAELDPVLRAQIRYGDWRKRPPGRKFRREFFVPVDELSTDDNGAPENLAFVRYFDLAATEPRRESDDPDWTAGCLMAKGRAGWIVVDVCRTRGTPGQVEAFIRGVTARDRNLYGPRASAYDVVIEQEPGASGKSTIHNYALKVLPGVAVHGQRSSGSKEERANPVAAKAEQGLVSVLRGPWQTDFFDEVEAFPYGGHDDQVDALSGAFRWLSERFADLSEGDLVWE